VGEHVRRHQGGRARDTAPHAQPAAVRLQGWLGTLFLGVVASAAVFVVYNRVLRELDASVVAPYLNLDPIVGVLTAAVFLGETLGAWQILGGVVALAGMWLASNDTIAPRPPRRAASRARP
jgi:drug/metabolite transporter (DMT)-like permease